MMTKLLLNRWAATIVFNRMLPHGIAISFVALYPMSIPEAARSKAWVCGRSLAGNADSNPVGRHICVPLVSVVCIQVEVSVSV